MLNNAQKRSLAITLRIIEQSLDEIARLAEREGGHIGTLYNTENDLSTECKEEFYAKAQLIRERITFLTVQFGFDSDVSTVSRIATTKLNYCWEILQKADMMGLRSYGPVDASLEKTLDPHIADLTELVIRLLSLLEGRAGSSDAGSLGYKQT